MIIWLWLRWGKVKCEVSVRGYDRKEVDLIDVEGVVMVETLDEIEMVERKVTIF